MNNCEPEGSVTIPRINGAINVKITPIVAVIVIKIVALTVFTVSISNVTIPRIRPHINGLMNRTEPPGLKWVAGSLALTLGVASLRAFDWLPSSKVMIRQTSLTST